jgi:hypothetical protein
LGWSDGWPLMTPVGEFLESVRQGNTLTTAALTATLDPNEVMRWSMQGNALLVRARGKLVVRARRPFADFAVALARAEAEAETAMVSVVRDVALSDVKDSWRAAAWLLDHQAKAPAPAPEDPDDEDELESLSTAVLNTED